eukprot:gene11105-7731_t
MNRKVVSRVYPRTTCTHVQSSSQWALIRTSLRRKGRATNTFHAYLQGMLQHMLFEGLTGCCCIVSTMGLFGRSICLRRDSFSAAKADIQKLFFRSGNHGLEQVDDPSVRRRVEKFLLQSTERHSSRWNTSQQRSAFRHRLALVLQEASRHRSASVAEAALRCAVERRDVVRQWDPAWVPLAVAACTTPQQLLRMERSIRSAAAMDDTAAQSALQQLTVAALVGAERRQGRAPPPVAVPLVAGVSALTIGTPVAASAVRWMRQSRATAVARPSDAFSRYFIQQRLVSGDAELLDLVRALRERPEQVTFHVHRSSRFAAATEALLSGRDGIRPLSWFPSACAAYAMDAKPSSPYALLLANRRLVRALARDRLISFQGVSSMLAAVLLDPRPGDCILDACAAPGSKTTLLADLVEQQSEGPCGSGAALMANDRSQARASELLQRVESAGLPWVAVTVSDAAAATAATAAAYDKVLVDAPCSGEGRLGRDEANWRLWHPLRGIEFYHQQVALLRQAIVRTKPGGYVLYTTCSFNPIENEAVVATVLREYRGAVRLAPLRHLPGPGALRLTRALATWRVPSQDGGFLSSHAEAVRRGEADMCADLFPGGATDSAADDVAASLPRHARRLMPHLNAGAEGFFYALLEVVSGRGAGTSEPLTRSPVQGYVQLDGKHELLRKTLGPFLSGRTEHGGTTAAVTLSSALSRHGLVALTRSGVPGLYLTTKAMWQLCSLRPVGPLGQREDTSLLSLGVHAFTPTGQLTDAGAALLHRCGFASSGTLSIPMDWVQLLVARSAVELEVQAPAEKTSVSVVVLNDAARDISRNYVLHSAPAAAKSRTFSAADTTAFLLHVQAAAPQAAPCIVCVRRSGTKRPQPFAGDCPLAAEASLLPGSSPTAVRVRVVLRASPTLRHLTSAMFGRVQHQQQGTKVAAATPPANHPASYMGTTDLYGAAVPFSAYPAGPFPPVPGEGVDGTAESHTRDEGTMPLDPRLVARSTCRMVKMGSSELFSLRIICPEMIFWMAETHSSLLHLFIASHLKPAKRSQAVQRRTGIAGYKNPALPLPAFMAAIPEPGEVFFDDDGNKSTILPDGCDPNYNPPQDELEEYAEFIGIDPATEPELMWIALEGLRTPLPPEWRACQTGDDEVYYFNFRTGENLWDHPMDATFKAKVITERANLKKNGSSNKPKAAADVSTKAGSDHTKNRQEGGYAKAVTASLLAGKSPVVSSGALAPVPSYKGRLTSLSGPGLDSSSRAVPDVSDILSSSAAPPHGNRLAGSQSELFLGSSHNSLHSSGLMRHEPTGPGKAPPQSAMEMEKAVRRRIEAEFESAFKTECTERERNYNAEKNRLDQSLHRSEEAINESWQAERETMQNTITASTSREVKEMEQNWLRRINKLKEANAELEKKVQEAKSRSTSLKPKGCTIEEYRETLRRENEEKLSAKRKELQESVNGSLKELEVEQQKALQELSKRTNEMMEATKKRLRSEQSQSLLQVHAGSQDTLTQLMMDLTRLKETLKKQQQEAQSKSKSRQPSIASIRAEKNKSPGVEVEALKKAQREADEKIKAVDAELDDEMDRLQESYQEQQRSLNTQLETLQKAIDTLKKETPELPPCEGISETSIAPVQRPPSLTEENIAKLAAEEASLREAVAKRVAAYEKETEELCRTKKAFLEKDTSSSPTPEAADSTSAASVLGAAPENSSGGASPVTLDKIRQTHLQQMKNLEYEHEQTMRKLRDAHHRALASQDRYDVRKSTEYIKMLNEKKKAWLAVHPTPNYNVDDLPDEEDLVEEELASLGPITAEEVSAEADKDTSTSPVASPSSPPLDHTEDNRLAQERLAMAKRLESYREQWAFDVAARVKQSRDKLDAEETRLAQRQRALEQREAERAKLRQDHDQRMAALRQRLEKAETDIAQCAPAAEKETASAPPSETDEEVEEVIEVIEAEEITAPQSPAGNATETDQRSAVLGVESDGRWMRYAEAQRDVTGLRTRWMARLDEWHTAIAAQRQELIRLLLVRPRPPVTAGSERAVPPGQAYNTAASSSHASNGDVATVKAAAQNTPVAEERQKKTTGRGYTPVSVAGPRNAAEEHTPFQGPQLLYPSYISSPDAVPPLPMYMQAPQGGYAGLYPPYSNPYAGPHPHAGADVVQYPEKIRAARQRLREQKAVLREKQRALVLMREEWREDMAHAKAERDSPAIVTLRQVRHRMEEQARRLNVAVLAMKLEREQLDDLQRFATQSQDPVPRSILRLVKQMTAQSKQLEDLLRRGSDEVVPAVKRSHSRRNERSQKAERRSIRALSQPGGAGSRDWEVLHDKDEIRWQKVNYQRQTYESANEYCLVMKNLHLQLPPTQGSSEHRGFARDTPRMVLQECPKDVRGLYVDVNGVIHPFCHGEGIDELPESTKIANILAYINLLVETVQPKGVLYLAVDGVAPRSKMNQQRARRYMSAANEGTAGEVKTVLFDSNSISPGTSFMDRVTIALSCFVEQRLAQGAWDSLAVILSDSNVPCEGEHKLIRFLRGQTGTSFFGEGHHVIVGLDADLIFLSLGLHTPHMTIMREPPAKREGRGKRTGSDAHTFEYFDVDSLGESLVTDIYQLSQTKGFKVKVDPSAFCRVGTSGYEFRDTASQSDATGCEAFHPCTTPYNSKIIDDFIVMAFLVGNDFMPRVPSAYCGESALDHLLECYVDDVLPYGFLTAGGRDLNPRQLLRLFKSYAEVEERLFLYRLGTEAVLDPAERAKRFAKIRTKYYESTNMSDCVEDACGDYLSTIGFVLRYYTTMHTVNWSWHYKYSYGPMAVDLAAYLESHPYVQAAALVPEENKPCEKLVQLISILPPTSAHLLPQKCHPLLSPVPSNPHVATAWKVDFTGAGDQDHLATVLLPFVDMKPLEEKFSYIRATLNSREIALNSNVKFHNLYFTSVSRSTATSLVGERGKTKTNNGVVCTQFLEKAPELEPRPRTYSYKALIHNGNVQAKPEDASLNHTAMIDFVVVCCLFSVAALLWAVGPHPIHLALPLLQMLSLFAAVVLSLYLLGLAIRVPPSDKHGISRFKGDRFLNWVCLSCNAANFERQNECFFCAAPCDTTRCRAFFTRKAAREADKMWDPDHTAYLRDYHCSNERSVRFGSFVRHPGDSRHSPQGRRLPSVLLEWRPQISAPMRGCVNSDLKNNKKERRQIQREVAYAIETTKNKVKVHHSLSISLSFFWPIEIFSGVVAMSKVLPTTSVRVVGKDKTFVKG